MSFSLKTYRNRLLFLAIIFLITIPLPAYWILNLQTDLIVRTRGQLAGLSQAQSLTESFYKRLNVYRPSSENETGGAAAGSQIDDIQNNLKNLAYDFQLSLNRYPIENEIIELILFALPQTFSQANAIHGAASNLELNAELERLKSSYERTISLLSRIIETYGRYDLKNKTRFQKAIAVFSHYRRDMGELLTLLEENKPQSSLLKTESFKQAADSSLKASLFFNEFLKKIYAQQLSYAYLQKYATLFALLFSILIVMSYLIFRVLTVHFEALKNHLLKIAKGMEGLDEPSLGYDIERESKIGISTGGKALAVERSKKGQYGLTAQDAFGPLALTLDRVGQVIHQELETTSILHSQLKKAHAGEAVNFKEQTKTQESEKTALNKLAKIASDIAKSSSSSYESMRQLTHETLNDLSADEIKMRLEAFKNRMDLLRKAANHIETQVDAMHHEVAKGKAILAFMHQVSDQMGLMSLSAAIESSHVRNNKGDFTKVSQDIKRFSENALRGASETASNLKLILDQIGSVKLEASFCVKEIAESANHLIGVNQDLKKIADQGSRQMNQFAIIGKDLKRQLQSAENILLAIEDIKKNPQDKT